MNEFNRRCHDVEVEAPEGPTIESRSEGLDDLARLDAVQLEA